MAARRDVTEGELAVLEVLWDRGPSAIRQVTDRLFPGGSAAQYATIQKQLERLEDKGFVARDRTLHVHLFSATMGRDELIGRQSLSLQIWSVREQRFQRLRPQKDDAAEWYGASAPNRVEDPPDQTPAADSTAGASSAAVLLAPRARAPDLIPEPLPSHVSAGFKSAPLLAPVAPRPPPVI